ncbi:hypothetical protein JMY81_14870 [Brenneria goodwinii]|uniref:hypothetical protein n=1 Tax=Brenneria goodwinii TaxID=1109412 RepID=UPI000EF21254|nr:hypothetical protein [Brenneria goodwinii]MCG8156529.1 hypothetical protein [Brenneria goodwinii]MCG8162100.1 hypothetical protein [Brenneria goodwinii]MCG8166858.1 hypothetical protein [Brenneria goodwinii]MCG8171508.1 hypothetical protein [Brenneria goodwinii]MCG8175069.1 hypothetical protein [Brenneria goodwinii]
MKKFISCLIPALIAPGILIFSLSFSASQYGPFFDSNDKMESNLLSVLVAAIFLFIIYGVMSYRIVSPVSKSILFSIAGMIIAGAIFVFLVGFVLSDSLKPQFGFAIIIFDALMIAIGGLLPIKMVSS